MNLFCSKKLKVMCHRKHSVSGYKAGNSQRASGIWGSSCVSGCRVCFLLEDRWRVICGSYASVEMRQHHIGWDREKNITHNYNSLTKPFNLHSHKLLPGIGWYADERFEGVLQVDLYKKKIDQSQAHISERKPHEYTENHSHLAMFLFCALLIHISGPKTDKKNP